MKNTEESSLIFGPWSGNGIQPAVDYGEAQLKTVATSQINGLDTVGSLGAPSPKAHTSPLNTTATTLPVNIDELTDADLKAMGFKSEWESWKNMKLRVKKAGLTLHPLFMDFKSFLKVMGPKPCPTFTIDRIDHTNPEYSPENCRWASKQLQSQNKGNAVHITDPQTGIACSLKEWSHILKVSLETLKDRRKKHLKKLPGWESEASILHGKEVGVVPKKYSKCHKIWMELIPHGNPESWHMIEQKYLARRKMLPHPFSKHEPREVWLLKEVVCETLVLHAHIIDCIDPETGFAPADLQEMYDRYSLVAQRAREYILMHDKPLGQRLIEYARRLGRQRAVGRTTS